MEFDAVVNHPHTLCVYMRGVSERNQMDHIMIEADTNNTKKTLLQTASACWADHLIINYIIDNHDICTFLGSC